MSLNILCTEYKENIHLFVTDSIFCSQCGKGSLYWENDFMVCDKCDIKRLPYCNEEIQHRYFSNDRIFCDDGHRIRLNWDTKKFECQKY